MSGLGALYAWLAGLLALLCLGLTALAALLERSGPIRLSHFAEEAGGRLRALYENSGHFEAFRYLLSLLARLLLAAVAILAALLGGELGLPPVDGALAALGLALVVAVASELLGRALVSRDPEQALRRLTSIYRFSLALLAPLVRLLAPVVPSSGNGEPAALEGEPEAASDDEIEAYIAVGTQEGILEPDEGELLRGIVDFGDTQVRSVMTPRIDMVCAPVNESLDALAQRFVDSGRSRIPLYKDSVDHIVGVLLIRDLLRGVRSAEALSAGDLARPAYFVPLTRPVDELLRELQSGHHQIAIVVDEYGGTAGLVTVEDLVEEIVGEIIDEPEDEGHGIEPLPDGSWRLDGRTHIEEVGDLARVDFGDVPYETVGGMILAELGEVPEYGAVVEVHGLRMTVEKVAERRIEMVRVEKARAAGAAPAEADGGTD